MSRPESAPKQDTQQPHQKGEKGQKARASFIFITLPGTFQSSPFPLPPYRPLRAKFD